MDAKMAATTKVTGRAFMPVDTGPQVHSIYGAGIDSGCLDAGHNFLTSENYGDRRDASRQLLCIEADRPESGSGSLG
jgi:hypothetical protein